VEYIDGLDPAPILPRQAVLGNAQGTMAAICALLRIATGVRYGFHTGTACDDEDDRRRRESS
jgi:hypothetical protein